MEHDPGISIVFCSVPDVSTGQKIAERLLLEKLAACISILPLLESHYVWEGKKEVAREYVLLIKLAKVNYAAAEAVISEIHPYTCPEILECQVSRGFPAYCSWILGMPVDPEAVD